MPQLRVLLLVLISILTTSSVEAESLLLQGSGPSGQMSPVTSDDEFLPIEQAYQLLPSVTDTSTLQLDWYAAPGYYLYQDRFKVWLSSADSPAKRLETQFESGTLRYDDYYEKELVVYYDHTRVITPLPNLEAAGGAITLKVESQACADAGLCYPPRTQFVEVDLTGQAAVVVSPPAQETINPASGATKTTQGLAISLLFALIGGMILNLMPCVFPVLSIKVLSLASSHLSSHGRHIHGLAYSAGVITTFVAVALALTVLRQGGEALGWGFQLQSPGFIIALIFLFFLMGLSFSGFFEAGARLMSVGQSATTGSGLKHSFATGALATLVASPCSAPFMGTALGFALTQPTIVALLIFATLGLGMALPFLVLTWIPGLLKWLPKPGPWMETLKEFLAFPLYLTCLWLLWILGNQTDRSVVISVLAGLISLAFAIWAWGKSRKFGAALALTAIVGAFYLPIAGLKSAEDEPLWQPYSEARLQQLLNDQEAVFVNLTADWCITCLANEKMALSSQEFATHLRNNNINYLKGDWTNYDAEITALLNENGRNGVPLYLFYSRGATQPQILPQILSRKGVISALSQK